MTRERQGRGPTGPETHRAHRPVRGASSHARGHRPHARILSQPANWQLPPQPMSQPPSLLPSQPPSRTATPPVVIEVSGGDDERQCRGLAAVPPIAGATAAGVGGADAADAAAVPAAAAGCGGRHRHRARGRRICHCGRCLRHRICHCGRCLRHRGRRASVS